MSGGLEGVTQRILVVGVHSLWHYFSWLLICGSLWGMGFSAHAMSSVRLDDGMGDVVLDGKFEVLVDGGAQLTVAEVQSPYHADRFAVTVGGRMIYAQCAHCIAGVSALPTAKQMESSTARKLK